MCITKAHGGRLITAKHNTEEAHSLILLGRKRPSLSYTRLREWPEMTAITQGTMTDVFLNYLSNTDRFTLKISKRKVR